MKKSQKKEWEFKGEITAFLTLLFVLMMSLVGALIESASIQITKSRKRADTLLALQSVFAEYDRDMLDEYDVFARQKERDDVLQKRMEYYGANHATHKVSQFALLSDNQGQPFYEQAVRYTKDKLGVQEPKYDFFSELYLEEQELVEIDLQELLEQGEATLPEEGNPLTAVNRLKSIDLLTLLVAEQATLSERNLVGKDLPSTRELKKGSWNSYEKIKRADRKFAVEYLMEHFGNFTGQTKDRALRYEQEYIIGGLPSDRENLKKVCEQILSIRMAVNYAYLSSDTGKQAEAEALAITLCSLMTVPGITQVVKHALLFAWAYGESIIDVRVLLKGKNVPLLKNNETWQLQLENLIKLGTEEEVVSEADVENGISYQNYIRGLLLLKRETMLSMRSLDLIENDLDIKVDECITKMQITSELLLRKGIKNTFSTQFAYR